MHVVFQFPIIDFRILLPGKAGKIVKPDWLNLEMNRRPFIRHFGSVKERYSGGSDEWSGEDYFCNSHLAMRYKELHSQGFPITTTMNSAIHNSYRRFFSNGYYVNKIEAGFVDNTEKLIRNNGAGENIIDIKDIIEHYADLSVTINNKETKLYAAGPLLAEQYFKESTLHAVVPDEQQKYVIDGEITIMVVFSTTEGLKLPKFAIKLEEFPVSDEFGGLKLYGLKLKHGGLNFKVWLIETPLLTRYSPPQAKNLLRNLRMNLLRVHLEKETIRLLLYAINNQIITVAPDSAESRKLDAYVKKSAEKLFENTKFTIPQASILGFALHSERVVAPGSFSSLEESIYYFQDQRTRENVEKILTGMTKKIVLFICTSPKDRNPLDFGHEFQQIKDVLRSSSDRTNFDIEIETSVKKKDFFDVLNRNRPDYLHMSMHSSLTDGLYFEDENSDKLPMPVDEFEKIMKAFVKIHRPEVVVLSACNSKKHAESIKAYCNYVVGTQAVFPADAGILYAAKFYSTLFNSNSTNIPSCHEAGQLAIEFYEKPFEPINGIAVYQIPVLIN